MRKHENTVGADQISMFVVCCMHSSTDYCIKDPPTPTASDYSSSLGNILHDYWEWGLYFAL